MVIYKFRFLYYQESLNSLFKAFGSCEQEFMANSDGQISTQLLANADVAGQDGEARFNFVTNSPLALNEFPSLVDLCKRCGRPPQIMPTATPK